MQKHVLLFSLFLLCVFNKLKAGDNPRPASLSGTYQVGTSQPVYKKLKDVAAALNNAGNTVTGNVIFELNSDYDGTAGETFPITFNQFNSSGNWTVTIRPKAGVSMRTTSGDPGYGNTVILLDGADNLVLDGRAGGTGSIAWLLRNTRTTTAAGSVIKLQNDAQYNVFTYLQIEGKDIPADISTPSLVYLAGTNKTQGNDFNTFSYCIIRERTDISTAIPLIGIQSVGTVGDAARFNSGNIIEYNNFLNLSSVSSGKIAYGIYLGNGTTATQVTHNSFYQTQALTANTASNTTIKSVYIGEASYANTIISDNFMGGSAPECGGGPFTMSGPYISYTGVETIQGSYSSASTGNVISNNTIRNFHLNSTSTQYGSPLFNPIRVLNGKVDITGNTIGSSTVNDDIRLTLSGGPSGISMSAIFVTSPSGGSITGNKIGGFTFATATGIANSSSFTGIITSFTPAYPFIYNIDSNLIGSTTMTDNIRSLSTTTPFGFYGITGGIFSATSTASIKNNTIAGASMAYTGTNWASTRGITLNGQATGVVDHNLISDISSATLGAADPSNTYTSSGGILISYGTSHTISNNIIRRLRLTGTGAVSGSSSAYSYILGINLLPVATSTVQIYNNQLYDFTSSNNVTSVATLLGGMHIQVNASIYNNLVALDNGANTNNCRINGILVNSTLATVNVFHNSLYIGGSNGDASNTAVSAAINRVASSGAAMYLRNNVLVNSRTGGNGAHYLFSNPTDPADGNWPVTGSDYNLLVTADETKTALWGSGGTELDFTQWKTTGGDTHSALYPVSQLAPSDLFTDPVTGDLSIKQSAEVYVAGKGVSGTGITTDYAGDTRDATTPSAGAYEYEYNGGGSTNTAPVITSDGGVPNVNLVLPENTITAATITATDADPGTTITYSILDTLDGVRFTIDPVTGVLSFAAAPDFENPADDDGNNIYFVLVQASDGQLTSEQRFKIKITNANDNPPLITSYSGAAGVNVTVAENTAAVATVTATDTDPAATITYSLENIEDAVKFSVNNATGELTFLAAPDYEQPGDSNGDNVYMVTVIASDGDSVAKQRFKVKVTDVNDNAPLITSYSGADTVQLQLPENAQPGIAVTAIDADAGAAITYSLLTGDDAALFTINSSTGELAFITPPDFEQPADADGDNMYVVMVKASDGSLSDTQQFRINVVDMNDNPAVVTMTLGMPENTVQVTVLEGTDADAGTIITFSILAQDDGALFRINPGTGALEFITAPDFETPADADSDNVYVVAVKMFDGATVTILRFRVRVADVDGAAARSASNATGRVSVMADQAVEETILRGGIKVYPNPVTGKRFTLRMDSIAAGRYTLELYGITGQLVYRQQLDHTGKSVLYPVHLPASLARGIYTLALRGENSEFTGKLMVE
ncbi:MAG: cadherin domain-containing protein [Chitinophagaceae bacterium]